MQNFKKALRSNIIKDCPVIEKDVDLAEAIFGLDVATLKGKTARRTPKWIVTDVVTVPPKLVLKHSSIILWIDVIYINKIGFMTSIGYPLYYCKTIIEIMENYLYVCKTFSVCLIYSIKNM